VLLPDAKVNPVNRNDWLECISALIMPNTLPPRLGVSSLMIVPSVIVGLAVPASVIVVAPCNVIDFVIFRREVHVNVPAGSVIVSPSWAALCKACTLATEPSD
jgi:hypothetical protein